MLRIFKASLFKMLFNGRVFDHCLLCIFCLFTSAVPAQDQLNIKIAMIGVDEKPHLPLSLIDLPVKDPALPGALMAVKENNQTGTFTGQVFDFSHHLISVDKPVEQLAEELQSDGVALFIADLPVDQLLKLSDSLAENGLVFNTRAQDDQLRNHQCRQNVLHVTPSRAMKTDALVQYLVWKHLISPRAVCLHSPAGKSACALSARASLRLATNWREICRLTPSPGPGVG